MGALGFAPNSLNKTSHCCCFQSIVELFTHLCILLVQFRGKRPIMYEDAENTDSQSDSANRTI